ncbi:FAD-dependent monooxygenase [Embleya sp. NBC_00896]|uniref:oxidoreductase n=1 Tax=Embleya sp. NBC_00896 TaxID=2975961 RepID=UPI0038701327|nr:FAD-dependent monooxygenase [Embleya sp. NBC_00896]
MRIAVIGGGPGGLYFAALAKQLSPGSQITLWERNAPDDTFGFGVVFSDETLDGIAQADPEIFAAMSAGFARWTDIDIRYGGRTLTSGGHGFAALGRERLLRILQQRCAALGVDLRYRTEAPPVDELARTHDLVVASDGVRSVVRDRYADTFRPNLDERGCRYMWLGTDKVFDAFTFIVDKHDFGVVQVHAYPFDDRRSTFIVELAEDAWRRGGFAEFAGRDLPPGASDEAGVRRCEALLAEHLDGHRLIPNNSRWIRFTTVRNATWHHDNVVLLGDAAHTAHFSIGSGTKLAMEDALALAACVNEHPDIPAALTAYEAERKPVVSSTQRAAQASLEWFENIDRAVGQAPEQFAFNLLTRSRRVTHANLLERDPDFVAAVDTAFTAGRADKVDAAPMFQPFRLGSVRLRNRVVVPPIATYAARDGIPGAFESAHLGALALGGASLVFAGMTAVTADGRATRSCPGLWSAAHELAWRDVVSRVRAQAPDGALLGIQLTHAGRRAATAEPADDGTCAPLGDDGWPTLAASAIPWDPAGSTPAEATRADLDEITAAFTAAAQRADRAGFDALELQYGHGHLLSGFLSPLTNRREDEYGGPLAGRLRFPLEVLSAVRAVWPADKPLVVRISAADWAEGGTTEDDAVRIARALAAAGADAIDVSTGEVVPHERPAYGRGYQTPFADLIRNATGVPTIAVGAISTYDDVNSILLAGRADLCAVGRAHLYDPLWTLHAAAEQGYAGPGAPWPSAWRPGSRKPPGAGSDRVPPRLHLLREQAEPVHRRWRPQPRLVTVPERG